MTKFETIDQLLHRAIGDGVLHAAGVAIVRPEGVAHEAYVGPVGPDTVWRYASMTKALTTVAVLQLVERGELDLDQPASDVVPELEAVPILTGWDGDEPRLESARSQPTVRQLLTHTSGLGYWFFEPDLMRWHEASGAPTIITGKKASFMTPRLFEPGARFSYGTSTDFAGLLVEEVAGRPLDEHLAEHVTAPVGMEHFTFWPDEPLPPIHQRLADGSLVPNGLELPGRAEAEWASGGHGGHGTTRDYTRFVQALLKGGGDLLRPATLDLALRDQLAGAPMPQVLRSSVAELVNDVPAPPVAESWGLGFHLVHEDVPGMRRAGTADWAGIFNSYYWIDRSSGLGAVFTTQVLPFYDRRIVELVAAIERAVYSGA